MATLVIREGRLEVDPIRIARRAVLPDFERHTGGGIKYAHYLAARFGFSTTVAKARLRANPELREVIRSEIHGEAGREALEMAVRKLG